MTTAQITIVFKGGASLAIRATESEKFEISQRWSDHQGDPAAHAEVGGKYNDGKGDLRLRGAEIAGMAFNDD